MPSQSIFRSQFNQLIQLLNKEDPGLGNFKIDKNLAQIGLTVELPIDITHLPTQFYFKISLGGSQFKATYFPGREPKEESRYTTDWSYMVVFCNSWVKIIKKELSQPDPWTLINQANILKDQIPSEPDSQDRFNEAEIARVHEYTLSLRQFLVSEIKPNESQLRLIDEKLRYLEESAKRQNKQDWAHTAIGITFTIAIGLALAPDQANRLFQVTSEFLRTLFIKLLT
jgi:hypothetical protein